MRGGLGRTLLTAFLILAIAPLSALSWYATRRERRDIQNEVIAKLSSLAVVVEAQVHQWAEENVEKLSILAAMPAMRESIHAIAPRSTTSSASSKSYTVATRDALRAQLRVFLKCSPAFHRLDVLDREGEMLVSTDPGEENPSLELVSLSQPQRHETFQFLTLDRAAKTGAVVTQPIYDSDSRMLGLLIGYLNLSDLVTNLQVTNDLEGKGEVYLVDASGIAFPQGDTVSCEGIEAALAGEEKEGLFENYAGLPVIGVYRRIPELELVLVAEQAQEESFAAADNVTATTVGATLVMALVTAIIAAVVTRQITRPVVQLTETALNIAQGNLEQRVSVETFAKDEIGILAHVFNSMAAELKSLYDDLEAKVAQRTALLQKANYQTQMRAIQLAATIEVSQAVTVILEPAKLLEEVVRMVHDRFDYSYVGVYMLDERREQLVLREGTGGGKKVQTLKAEPVPLGKGRAVGKAALAGKPLIVQWDAEQAEEMFGSSYIQVEAVIPLVLGDQVIGVLDILNTKGKAFDADTISVLQNVANQITIALENARIYKQERETARRLRETEEFRSRFLAHMSHELREPLTNIIGFSRLILKGLDGSINKQQQKDLEIIYANSQHLLGLINDLLDVSQIEAGLVELTFQELNLAELVKSVMSTTSALVRDKDIELRQKIAPLLPPVKADEARIRQVLLRILSNAAKFTEEGHIEVRVWPDNEEILISVRDTGVGIPPEDQKRIFEQFQQGTVGGASPSNGTGLGLALSKEFVEMHGGEIEVESEVGKGSKFTFSLPLEPQT